MMKAFRTTKSLAAFGVLTGTFLLSSGAVLASTCVPSTAGNLCTTYELSGVTLATTPTTPQGISYTGTMTGQFNWEYTPGDFANGIGTFTSLVVPWTSHSMADLNLQIDNVSLSGTLPGNFHSDGVDFYIALQGSGLTSPTQGSGIDFAASTFDIWGSTGYEYIGNFTAGSIIVSPVPLPAAAWLFGSGLFAMAGITRKRKSA